MSELLKIVLSLSLSGTLIFFIILALRLLYKNKLSKTWQYYIWLIVIARMLIPFTPETTPVGLVFKYLGSTKAEIIQTTPTANNTQPDFDADINYIEPNAEPQEKISTAATTPPLSVQYIFSKLYENLWILWAVTAFALLIRKITIYQSFVRFVKAGRTEAADIEILNMLSDAGETIGVKRRVELFINPLVSSPMLLGFFCPYIILPSIKLDKTELAYIMRHELTHYKHLDMFYKWLVQITVCLHWFNPFAYLLTKEINKCCELSCDEAVIRTMNKEEKKAYGGTLLNALKAMGNYKDKLAAVTLAESAEQLIERLDAIMKYKKKSKATAVITLALTTMLCVGAATVGAYAAPQTIKRLTLEEVSKDLQAVINSCDDKAWYVIEKQGRQYIYYNNLPHNYAYQYEPNQSSISIADVDMGESTGNYVLLSVPLNENLTISYNSKSVTYVQPSVSGTKELAISFDIHNGGVEILPAASNKITASYDEEYYDVDITDNNGKWNISISGKVSMMGKTSDVQLYVPNAKCTMDVNVLNGNFSYALPENCADKISITAQNAGIDFISKNQYKNSAISLTAANKDIIKYQPPVFPNYFTKTSTGFEYANGTQENKINISLTGYTSVNFLETPAAAHQADMGGTDQLRQ